jgi:hypothetical protein
MSTDEKSEPQPTDSGPKVRVIDINLSELLQGASPADVPKSLPPLEVLASSLAVITVMKEAREQRHIEELLLGAWGVVFKRLHRRSTPPTWEIQTSVLHEYFTHSGDWSKMRDCLIQKGSALQSRPGEFHELYEDKLKEARSEYAENFGGASGG